MIYLLKQLGEKFPGIDVLIQRAYPDLKRSGVCSRHQSDGHFECAICYPDYSKLLDAHVSVKREMQEEITDMRDRLEKIKQLTVKF